MLRSELIDAAVKGLGEDTDRDFIVAILDVVEPIIRAEERERWRADLQSALDLLAEGK